MPINSAYQAKLLSSKVERVFLTLRADVLAPDQVHSYVERELPSARAKVIRGSRSPLSALVQGDEVRRSKYLKQVIEDYTREYVSLGKWSAKTITVNRHAKLTHYQQWVNRITGA